MKIIVNTALIFCVVLLARCSSLPKAPGEPEFAVAQKKWSDAKMEDMKSGHTIYTTRCNSCHGLKPMNAYDETTWGKLIDVMAPKAKLNAAETEQLRKYIYSARETASK